MRLARSVAPSICLLLLLAACGKSSDGPANPSAPADAPALSAPLAVSDFPGDFNLNGGEPPWTLDIRKDALVLKQPGKPDIKDANPGSLMVDGEGTWMAKDFKIRLSAAVCTDGVSERLYPYTAVVEQGGNILRGCADRPKPVGS